jgi:hypothetical protein
MTLSAPSSSQVHINCLLTLSSSYDVMLGRPLRVRKSPYIQDWEDNRQADIKELTSKGVIPAHE